MKEIAMKLLTILWILLAGLAYLFVVISAIGAATNDEWLRGCFWVLVLILFRVIDLKERNDG